MHLYKLFVVPSISDNIYSDEYSNSQKQITKQKISYLSNSKSALSFGWGLGTKAFRVSKLKSNLRVPHAVANLYHIKGIV